MGKNVVMSCPNAQVNDRQAMDIAKALQGPCKLFTHALRPNYFLQWSPISVLCLKHELCSFSHFSPTPDTFTLFIVSHISTRVNG